MIVCFFLGRNAASTGESCEFCPCVYVFVFFVCVFMFVFFLFTVYKFVSENEPILQIKGSANLLNKITFSGEDVEFLLQRQHALEV